jgi:hypothetical protein
LKSAIPAVQKGCDGIPSQQFPPELLRASGQDTVLMTDLHARMEFTVKTPMLIGCVCGTKIFYSI